MTYQLEKTATQYVTTAKGVRFAYRRLGQSSGTASVPLICQIHYRANMDFWDPLLVNSIAKSREVIVFDNIGIGRTDGDVPDSFQGWADGIITLAQALHLHKIDLLGFSMGGVAVQYVSFTAPSLVRKLIIAGSRPSAPLAHGPLKDGAVAIAKSAAPVEYITALANAEDIEAGKEALAYSCFPDTVAGRVNFERYWERLHHNRIEPLNLQLLEKDKAKNQFASSMLDGKQSADPDFLKTWTADDLLKMPVLIANGDNDLLIPTSRSWELFNKIENAKVLIYPRAGHGFLWQYAESFAAQVNEFLDYIDVE